ARRGFLRSVFVRPYVRIAGRVRDVPDFALRGASDTDVAPLTPERRTDKALPWRHRALSQPIASRELRAGADGVNARRHRSLSLWCPGPVLSKSTGVGAKAVCGVSTAARAGRTAPETTRRSSPDRGAAARTAAPGP